MSISTATMSYLILIILILAINITFFYLWHRNKRDVEKKKEELRQEKAARNERVDEYLLEDEVEHNTWYAWAVGITVCLDVWILGAVLTHLWAAHFFTHVANEDNNKALFGDSFGAVNALISAFAFAGMIVAVMLQRHELRLQRHELRQTYEEMEQQTTQMSEENKTFRIQRFENTFFQMLGLLESITNQLSFSYLPQAKSKGNLSFRPEEEFVEGRELFREAFEKVPHQIGTPTGDPARPARRAVSGMRGLLKEEGLTGYNNSYSPTYFDHYFRMIYRILKYTKESRLIEEDERYNYACILRAMLSRYELVWLYYNGLSPVGRDKLKPLLEHFCILKNLRTDLLAFSKESEISLTQHRRTIRELEQSNYSCTDYEFNLTEVEDNPAKYQLKAFYREDTIDDGRQKLAEFTTFLNQAQ